MTVDLNEIIGQAVISWSAAQDTTSKADLIGGSVVIALNGGSTAPAISGGGAGGTGNYSFTAADFTTVEFLPTGADAGDTPTKGTSGNVYNPDVITTTGDTEFDDLVASLTYSKGTPTGIDTGTLVLRGLQSGTSYAVQIFYNHQNGDNASRVMSYGDGNGNTVGLLAGDVAPDTQTDHYGQFAVGTFTAVDNTQALTLATDGTFSRRIPDTHIR